MTDPTPPANTPLFEGLDPSWNDIVSAFPEDKRGELAPLLKSKLDEYEPLKQWEDYSKSGLNKEHVDSALNIMSIIENDPKQVYELLQKHLGLTPQEAQQAVDDVIENSDGEDPRWTRMEQQLNTLSQIMLGNHQQTLAQQQQAAADAAIQKDLDGLKAKYGNVDEAQVVMRMLHLDMSPEEAYQDYTKRDAEIIRRRPSPMLMPSNGNAIPNKQIDVRKLDGRGTRDLVAQMFEHDKQERRS